MWEIFLNPVTISFSHNYVYCTYNYIGQFLNSGVDIDTENMLMRFSDHKPIPVKKGRAWSFLGIDKDCWYGMATDNQGAGVIDGVYTDYIVPYLIPQ